MTFDFAFDVTFFVFFNWLDLWKSFLEVEWILICHWMQMHDWFNSSFCKNFNVFNMEICLTDGILLGHFAFDKLNHISTQKPIFVLHTKSLDIDRHNLLSSTAFVCHNCNLCLSFFLNTIIGRSRCLFVWREGFLFSSHDDVKLILIGMSRTYVNMGLFGYFGLTVRCRPTTKFHTPKRVIFLVYGMVHCKGSMIGVTK